jgi:hypothetical protein
MSIDSRADDPIGGRSRYAGATMRVCWQWVREAGVVAAGFDDLNLVHLELIRYPTLGGLHPTKLAERWGLRSSRSTTCSAIWTVTGTW